MFKSIVILAFVAVSMAQKGPFTDRKLNRALDSDLSTFSLKNDNAKPWLSVDGVSQKWHYVFDLPLSNGSATLMTKGLVSMAPYGKFYRHFYSNWTNP